MGIGDINFWEIAQHFYLVESINRNFNGDIGISICFVRGDQAIRSRIDITEPDLSSPFFDTCSLEKNIRYSPRQ